MIEVNKDYKYKELCALRGENIRTGKSKQLQLKDWKRFFEWDNPTTQIYRVTKVYDEPKEKIDARGGVRKGAGAKAKVQDEFNYLFNAFMFREYERNAYNVKAVWGDIYFTNSEIDTYFGLRCENYYEAKNDDSVNDFAFQKVTEKLTEKRRSWIINKIKKIDNITFQNGIVAYKDNGTFDYRDDLLEEWNTYQNNYMHLMGFRSMKDVIEKEKWADMIDYISQQFEGYARVIKCHKVQTEISMLKRFELEEIDKQRLLFNQKIVEELNAFFSKQENASDYIYIINKYVKTKEQL